MHRPEYSALHYSPPARDSVASIVDTIRAGCRLSPTAGFRPVHCRSIACTLPLGGVRSIALEKHVTTSFCSFSGQFARMGERLTGCGGALGTGLPQEAADEVT